MVFCIDIVHVFAPTLWSTDIVEIRILITHCVLELGDSCIKFMGIKDFNSRQVKGTMSHLQAKNMKG